MRAALECEQIDHVFVASEDEEIRAVAARLIDPRLSVIDRDPATATDEASTESALLEFAEKYEFGRVVLIQATSPLLEGADLRGALAKFDETDADSLLSVTREHRFIWRADKRGGVSAKNYEPNARPRRQEWSGELFENGAFYIATKEALLESSCRLSGHIEAFEMPPTRSLELDEPGDWNIAYHYLAERQSSNDLRARCEKIKLLVTDVDGVLTDGGMYYGPDGEALKKFNTRDGMGLGLWRESGRRVAIMTSEDTAIVSRRAEKLQIDTVMLGVKNKKEALTRLLDKEGLSPQEVAFIGDDINDLGALSIVGLAACPSDATNANRSLAHYVCKRRGGEGCVRELVDLILGCDAD